MIKIGNKLYESYVNKDIPEIVYPALFCNNGKLLGSNLLFEGIGFRHVHLNESNKLWYTQLIENYLKDNNIRYYRELPLIPVNITHCVYIDFYLIDYKICLEIDGITHFGRENYDDLRDMDMSILGLTTLRIKSDELKTDPKLKLNLLLTGFNKTDPSLNYFNFPYILDSILDISYNPNYKYVMILNRYFKGDIIDSINKGISKTYEINKRVLFNLFNIPKGDNHTYRKYKVPFNFIEEKFNIKIKFI